MYAHGRSFLMLCIGKRVGSLSMYGGGFGCSSDNGGCGWVRSSCGLISMLWFSILYTFFKVFGGVCVAHGCVHWVWHVGSQNNFLTYSNAVFSIFVDLL